VTESSSPQSRARYAPLSIALGVFVAAATLVLMGVQPILVGLYSDHLHLSLSQNGWVLAAEQFGGAAGALLGYWVSTRFRWSHVIVGACILAAAVNVATAYATGFGDLMAARFISGLTSTVAYTVAIYFLGHSAKPDRVFGLLMVLQTAFFSVDAMVLPVIDAHFGYVITIGSSTVWFAAALLAALWLPPGPGGPDAPPAAHIGNPAARPIVGAAALLGAFLLQLSIFAVWGFLERIGRADGLSEEQIGLGIGIGVLGGIPGGLLPALIGDRFGRISMITISAAMLVASYIAFATDLHLAGYVLWITILNVGWVLGLTYYMGLTVMHDPDGRLTRLIPFSQILSAGVGPACSALVTTNERLAPIFIVASISATAGLGAILLAINLRRVGSAAPTT
jgi:predicted MFS family arabinose efflux permease